VAKRIGSTLLGKQTYSRSQSARFLRPVSMTAGMVDSRASPDFYMWMFESMCGIETKLPEPLTAL
jgi:hypothetical protein